MSYAISFSGEFLVMTIEGECHPNEVAVIVMPIIRKLKPEMNKSLLIDARAVTNLTTTEEVREYVHLFGTLPFSNIAIAVTNPANYGMARMFAAYSEIYNKQEIGVFYDIEKAQRWLSH
jgi:hypothetical protein